MKLILRKLPKYQLIPNGDSAITIMFAAAPSERLTRQVISLQQELLQVFGSRLINIVPSYQNITIYFSPLKENYYHLRGEIIPILERPIAPNQTKSRKIEIPVCYEEIYAPDLKKLATYCKLSIKNVLSSSQHYTRETFTFSQPEAFKKNAFLVAA